MPTRAPSTTEVLPPEPRRRAGGGARRLVLPARPAGRARASRTRTSSTTRPLGPTPAWLIPGTSSTWVVLHARPRCRHRGEGLRIASTVADLGYPMLLIRYRNDAPALRRATDTRSSGSTSGEDVEGGRPVRARQRCRAGRPRGHEHGRVGLARASCRTPASPTGWSGAFLDAPMTRTSSQGSSIGAADMGIPPFVAGLAMQVAHGGTASTSRRPTTRPTPAGFVTPDADRAGHRRTTTVPPEVTADFAAAAPPGLVTLELFDGAGHSALLERRSGPLRGAAERLPRRRRSAPITPADPRSGDRNGLSGRKSRNCRPICPILT